jgi:hypothetical protein
VTLQCIKEALHSVAPIANKDLSFFSYYLPVYTGKAIPLQAWAGPEGFKKVRLSDFKTIGT